MDTKMEDYVAFCMDTDIIKTAAKYADIIENRCVCPICRKGTVTLYKESGLFRCDACLRSGNAVTLVSYMENKSTEEAATLIKGIGMHSDQDIQYSIIRDAALWFYLNLHGHQGMNALRYLKDRGLTDETIKRFGLGYGGSEFSGLLNHLRKKGYGEEDLDKSGLFCHGRKGLFDRFRDRVMFPIYSASGHVIAFGGRIMAEKEDSPKYLNSPETEIFHKSENLFGLQFARDSKEGSFILCEGYMDVIALHQAGFDNAIASLGTSLTELQSRIISRYVEKAVITYDSDAAGTKAAARALPMLNEAGISVRKLNMEPCKDPDEFIVRFGASAYRERIVQAEQI